MMYSMADLLVRWAQDLVLSKAHMEGRASQRAILMLNNYHVNGTAQRGRIDAVVCLLDRAVCGAYDVHVGLADFGCRLAWDATRECSSRKCTTLSFSHCVKEVVRYALRLWSFLQ